MATGRLLLQMTLMGLPARPRLGAGLFEMDALVHVIDPRKRDEMVLTAGVGIILGQLDLIPTFQTVHSADVHAVRTEDFHMFLDHRRCDHVVLHCFERYLAAMVGGSSHNARGSRPV